MKYLLRQSLISSWDWAMKLDNMERFISDLKKEDRDSQIMATGREFEDHVTAALNGTMPDKKLWCHDGVIRVAKELVGATLQVTLYKTIVVDDIEFLLRGTLDALRAGEIFDIKYTDEYKDLNKFYDSPQTPAYFLLCPEAKRFTYLISDGKELYREWYYPDEVVPLECRIRAFVAFLRSQNLLETYYNYWRVTT